MPEERSTEEIVYEFVCNHPGLCTYAISKKLGMTGGRVRFALTKLKKGGLVKFKFDRSNPRIKKLTYPIDAFSLLPKSLKNRVKVLAKRKVTFKYHSS